MTTTILVLIIIAISVYAVIQHAGKLKIINELTPRIHEDNHRFGLLRVLMAVRSIPGNSPTVTSVLLKKNKWITTGNGYPSAINDPVQLRLMASMHDYLDEVTNLEVLALTNFMHGNHDTDLSALLLFISENPAFATMVINVFSMTTFNNKVRDQNKMTAANMVINAYNESVRPSDKIILTGQAVFAKRRDDSHYKFKISTEVLSNDDRAIDAVLDFIKNSITRSNNTVLDMCNFFASRMITVRGERPVVKPLVETQEHSIVQGGPVKTTSNVIFTKVAGSPKTYLTFDLH